MPLLWLLVGYAFGSIPTAYLVARKARGIDIRDYGSGNVGGSNVYQQVGVVAAAFVGLVDAAKCALPALGVRWLLGSEAAQAAVVLGAVAGHCWSPFLGFTGGRGMAPGAAGILTFWIPGAIYIVVMHLLGSAVRLAALADIVAMAALPALVYAFGRGGTFAWLCAVMLLLLVAKRLHANRLPLPADPVERRRVLIRRLLFDRDVPRGQAWVRRGPQE